MKIYNLLFLIILLLMTVKARVPTDTLPELPMANKMYEQFPNYYKAWDETQNITIRDGIANNVSFMDIAHSLGRNPSAVVTQAEKLKMVKTTFNSKTRCLEIYVNGEPYECIHRSKYRSL